MKVKDYISVLLETFNNITDQFCAQTLFILAFIYISIPGAAFPVMILSTAYAFIWIVSIIKKEKSITNCNLDHIILTLIVLIHSTIVSILSVLYFLSKIPNLSIFDISNTKSVPFFTYSVISFIMTVLISLVIYGIIYFIQLFNNNLKEYKQNKQYTGFS